MIDQILVNHPQGQTTLVLPLGWSKISPQWFLDWVYQVTRSSITTPQPQMEQFTQEGCVWLFCFSVMYDGTMEISFQMSCRDSNYDIISVSFVTGCCNHWLHSVESYLLTASGGFGQVSFRQCFLYTSSDMLCRCLVEQAARLVTSLFWTGYQSWWSVDPLTSRCWKLLAGYVGRFGSKSFVCSSERCAFPRCDCWTSLTWRTDFFRYWFRTRVCQQHNNKKWKFACWRRTV